MKSVHAKELTKLTFDDFWEILQKLPDNCPLIGGQAVGWWTLKYLDPRAVPTSKDMDLWGSRDDLNQIAKILTKKAVYPHQYEMTVWVGSVSITLNDVPTSVEVLHTVPGVDAADPLQVSVSEEYRGRKFLVLDPVALIYSKIHSLRHFDQSGRNDLKHLELCIAFTAPFIKEILTRNCRLALGYCNRVLKCQKLAYNQRLEKKYRFDLLKSIPVEALQAAGANSALPKEDRVRITKFLANSWKRAA